MVSFGGLQLITRGVGLVSFSSLFVKPGFGCMDLTSV